MTEGNDEGVFSEPVHKANREGGKNLRKGTETGKCGKLPNHLDS